MLRRVLAGLFIVAALAAGALWWFLRGDGVRLALERQATAWLGQPVQIARASAQFFPRLAIHLSDVRIGAPARIALAEVSLSTDLSALLSRRIDDGEIEISNSRVEMPLPFAIPASGENQTSSSAGEADARGGISVTAIRSIALRDVRLVSRGREIVVSADSSLVSTPLDAATGARGTQVNVSRFSANAGATSIEARGVIKLLPRVDATLDATANQLDVDDLLALSSAFSTSAPTSRARSDGASAGQSVASAFRRKITAKVSSPRATVAGLELGRFATTLVADGNRATLSPLAFDLFDGRYEGSLDVTAATTLGVTLNTRIDRLDVAKLAAFGGVANSITGRLSGNGRFTGRGRDVAAVLAAATGGGSIEIADGVMPRLDLIRTVILFFGRPSSSSDSRQTSGNPTGSGNHFDRITSTFTLARQVIHADSLMLQSPDLDVAAAGTLAIPTKALAGRGDLVLSEALSKQAGTDLYRYTREGNRIVLPAVIGGTLDQPRVTIDAAAAARRGLKHEVERRLKGLLDGLKRPPG